MGLRAPRNVSRVFGNPALLPTLALLVSLEARRCSAGLTDLNLLPHEQLHKGRGRQISKPHYAKPPSSTAFYALIHDTVRSETALYLPNVFVSSFASKFMACNRNALGLATNSSSFVQASSKITLRFREKPLGCQRSTQECRRSHIAQQRTKSAGLEVTCEQRTSQLPQEDLLGLPVLRRLD